MMILQPKNWTTFQHYKDRKPPWIKLHRNLLDDYQFFCLPIASKAIAACIWLLASEYQDGIINTTEEEISFRLHMPLKDVKGAINPLIDSGFLIDLSGDSETLAEREQESLLEVEKRQRERERRVELNALFEELWKQYPRKDGKKGALVHFTASVKTDENMVDIKTALCNYNLSVVGQEKQYIKNGSTWFNNWPDWVEWEAKPKQQARPMPGINY